MFIAGWKFLVFFRRRIISDLHNFMYLGHKRYRTAVHLPSVGFITGIPFSFRLPKAQEGNFGRLVESDGIFIGDIIDQRFPTELLM